MTKRVAANQMTKDNWMNEDEPEEAGIFEEAPTARLQTREIKKARRRIEKNGVVSSPFGQFAGLVGSSKAPFSAFNFKAGTPKSNGTSSSPAHSEITSVDKTISNSATPLRAKTLDPLPVISERFNSTSTSDKNSSYLEKLKQLNVSFLKWVQEHMSKSQYCDFSPVCADYIKHMKQLECLTSLVPAKQETAQNVNLPSQPKFDLAKKNSPAKGTETTQPRPAVSFNFPMKNVDQKSASSIAKPFSFAANAAPKKEPNNGAGDDEDEKYVPPKNEFQAVKEDDAVYSKRCKLFYKKDENYVDKGVGTLYLKQDKDKKVQLVVRADTSTGLILLNICLSSGLPVQRLGKNNVLIVCIPNPPIDPKTSPEPTPFLFRVKTSEDADNLLENLNKYKEC